MNQYLHGILNFLSRCFVLQTCNGDELQKWCSDGLNVITLRFVLLIDYRNYMSCRRKHRFGWCPGNMFELIADSKFMSTVERLLEYSCFDNLAFQILSSCLSLSGKNGCSTNLENKRKLVLIPQADRRWRYWYSFFFVHLLWKINLDLCL